MNLFATFGLIIGFFLASFLKMGFFIGLIFSVALSAIFRRLFGGNNRGYQRQNESTESSLFLITTFEVLGHISKSKGVITPLDIESANQLMQALGVHGASKSVAQDAFRRGKQNDYPLQQKIVKLRNNYLFRPYFLNLFMEIQIKHVLIDGVIQINERNKLEVIASTLGIDALQFEQLVRQYNHNFSYERGSTYQQQYESTFYRGNQQTELQDAYTILQVTSSDTAIVIKRAYKRLMGQYHPDKIVAKTASAKEIEAANRKAQEIQAAYQLIKQSRPDL